jgi:naphtho-gamma-pyrone polyketide synthase
VPSDTVIVGLCSGLLASAAVSASRSLLDLTSIALKVVRVAFRIGVKVDATARRLSIDHHVDAGQSWSRLALEVQRETAIAEVIRFNKAKVSNTTARILPHPQNQQRYRAYQLLPKHM